MARTARFLALGLLGLVLASVLPEALRAQQWATLSQARQVAGEGSLAASVRYGAGDLRIGPAEPGSLYRLDLRYDEESFRPAVSYGDGSLSVGVDQSDDAPRRLRSGRTGELELALSRDVPTDLDLEFGAVRADLDLGGVRLRALRLATGASDSRIRVAERNAERMDEARFQVGAARFEGLSLANLNADRIVVEAGVGDLTLDFGGDWAEERTVALSAEVGLGSLTIQVPDGVGVRLSRDTFLMPLDAPDLRERNGEMVSEGWEGAERRLDISVSGALGRIRVARSDGA